MTILPSAVSSSGRHTAGRLPLRRRISPPPDHAATPPDRMAMPCRLRPRPATSPLESPSILASSSALAPENFESSSIMVAANVEEGWEGKMAGVHTAQREEGDEDQLELNRWQARIAALRSIPRMMNKTTAASMGREAGPMGAYGHKSSVSSSSPATSDSPSFRLLNSHVLTSLAHHMFDTLSNSTSF